jgi:hypothetical protein
LLCSSFVAFTWRDVVTFDPVRSFMAATEGGLIVPSPSCFLRILYFSSSSFLGFPASATMSFTSFSGVSQLKK